jgi:nitrite reductase (NO-forming)
MTEAGSPAERCLPAWPKDALRIAFGVVWGIDAALKWLPGFRSGYLDAIKSAGDNQPAWLHPWFRFWYDLQSPHPYAWAYVVAIIETLVALAVIAGFARKLTYIAGGVFSLLIWGVAEGFGGPYTSGAADIGTAIIYTMVFGFMLIVNYYAGPARYSADYHLEQRYSWWWKLAEMRRPATTQAAVPALRALPAAEQRPA